jgi:ATP-dependent DNA helicase PIF1
MIDSYIKDLEEGVNLFITGAAGVGKSYTTNAIVKAYEDKEKQVVKLASTAMAATHIAGQTIHSFLDLRLHKSTAELEKSARYKLNNKLKKVIQSTDLIVIDEISMVSAGVLELIRLRLVQAGYTKGLMVVGDFLQLAPVVKHQEKMEYCHHHEIENSQEVFGFAFDSPSWKIFDFKVIHLTEVHRTKDHDFMLLLDDIRRGIFAAPHEHYLSALFKEPPKHERDYTYLFSTNAKSDTHNQKVLAELDSKEQTLTALLSGDKQADEVIEKFCRDIKVNRNFIIKEGADILFTKNSWNYYNGERGKVKRIDIVKGVLVIEKSNGTHVKVERERFEKRGFEIKEIEGVEQSVEVVYFSILQFPIALAYAITIHKAQGMGIEDLVIDTSRIFAPSQFYVALSRAISPSRLILQGDPRKLRSIVYVDKSALGFYQSLGIV